MATWAERAAGARDYADMLALALEIRASFRSYIRSQITTREQTARVRFWKLLDALQATN
jgi:hypothetical protein